MRVLWVCARVVLGVGVVVEGVPCVTARVRVRACALGVCAYWRVVLCAPAGVVLCAPCGCVRVWCGWVGMRVPPTLVSWLGGGGGGRVVFVWLCCGGVLLSHDLSIAVPLALPGLASRFGMLLGVSPVL